MTANVDRMHTGRLANTASPREIGHGVAKQSDELCSQTRSPAPNDAEADAAWVLGCKECKWWSPPPLIGNATTASDLVRQSRQRQRSLPRKSSRTENELPRLAWFVCVTQPKDGASNRSSDLASNRSSSLSFPERNVEGVKVAILSALAQAPSLVPHVVYLLSENQQFRQDSFTRWLSVLHVPVIVHRLSFMEHLAFGGRNRYTPKNLNFGTYGRIELPLIASELLPNWASRGIDEELLLYTDADVIFAGDVNLRELEFGAVQAGSYTVAAPSDATGLHTFAAGTEMFNHNPLNAGVLLMNISAMRAELPAMIAYAVSRKFNFFVADQSWLQEWFSPEAYVQAAAHKIGSHPRPPHRLGWHRLRDDLWNARGFAHPRRNNDSTFISPRIWHWHGAKLVTAECWLRETRRRGLSCSTSSRVRRMNHFFPKCAIRPELKVEPCVLRTYAWLMRQHQEILRIADEIACSGHRHPMHEVGTHLQA